MELTVPLSGLLSDMPRVYTKPISRLQLSLADIVKLVALDDLLGYLAVGRPGGVEWAEWPRRVKEEDLWAMIGQMIPQITSTADKPLETLQVLQQALDTSAFQVVSVSAEVAKHLFTAWFAYIQQQRFSIEVHPGDGFPAVTVSPSPEGSESQAKRQMAATSTTDAPAPRTPEVLHTRVVASRPVKAGHINKAGDPTLVDMKGLDSVVVVAPRCTKDDLENAGLADDCVLLPVPDKPYRVVMGPGSRLRKACDPCTWVTAANSDVLSFVSTSYLMWKLKKGEEAFSSGGELMDDTKCDEPNHATAKADFVSEKGSAYTWLAKHGAPVDVEEEDRADAGMSGTGSEEDMPVARTAGSRLSDARPAERPGTSNQKCRIDRGRILDSDDEDEKPLTQRRRVALSPQPSEAASSPLTQMGSPMSLFDDLTPVDELDESDEQDDTFTLGDIEVDGENTVTRVDRLRTPAMTDPRGSTERSSVDPTTPSKEAVALKRCRSNVSNIARSPPRPAGHTTKRVRLGSNPREEDDMDKEHIIQLDAAMKRISELEDLLAIKQEPSVHNMPSPAPPVAFNASAAPCEAGSAMVSLAQHDIVIAQLLLERRATDSLLPLLEPLFTDRRRYDAVMKESRAITEDARQSIDLLGNLDGGSSSSPDLATCVGRLLDKVPLLRQGVITSCQNKAIAVLHNEISALREERRSLREQVKQKGVDLEFARASADRAKEAQPIIELRRELDDSQKACNGLRDDLKAVKGALDAAQQAMAQWQESAIHTKGAVEAFLKELEHGGWAVQAAKKVSPANVDTQSPADHSQIIKNALENAGRLLVKERESANQLQAKLNEANDRCEQNINDQNLRSSTEEGSMEDLKKELEDLKNEQIAGGAAYTAYQQQIADLQRQMKDDQMVRAASDVMVHQLTALRHLTEKQRADLLMVEAQRDQALREADNQREVLHNARKQLGVISGTLMENGDERTDGSVAASRPSTPSAGASSALPVREGSVKWEAPGSSLMNQAYAHQQMANPAVAADMSAVRLHPGVPQIAQHSMYQQMSQQQFPTGHNSITTPAWPSFPMPVPASQPTPVYMAPAPPDAYTPPSLMTPAERARYHRETQAVQRFNAQAQRPNVVHVQSGNGSHGGMQQPTLGPVMLNVDPSLNMPSVPVEWQHAIFESQQAQGQPMPTPPPSATLAPPVIPMPRAQQKAARSSQSRPASTASSAGASQVPSLASFAQAAQQLQHAQRQRPAAQQQHAQQAQLLQQQQYFQQPGQAQQQQLVQQNQHSLVQQQQLALQQLGQQHLDQQHLVQPHLVQQQRNQLSQQQQKQLAQQKLDQQHLVQQQLAQQRQQMPRSHQPQQQQLTPGLSVPAGSTNHPQSLPVTTSQKPDSSAKLLTHPPIQPTQPAAASSRDTQPALVTSRQMDRQAGAQAQLMLKGYVARSSESKINTTEAKDGQ